jgi:hypothetical protein
MNTTSNDPPSKEEIQRRKNALREHHQPLLDALGIPLVYVMGKMHKEDAQGNPVIFLFPTELEKGDDVYIEFTTREYIPSTKERKLYKWKFNKDWRKIYPAVDGSDHRLVPFKEFEEVLDPRQPSDGDQRFPLPVPGDEEDAPMKEMTMRDYMAIHRNLPVSLKPWLNTLIIKNKQ